MFQSLHFIISSLYSAQKYCVWQVRFFTLRERSITCFLKVKFNACPYFICRQRSHSEGLLLQFLLQGGLSWIPNLDPVACCVSRSSLCTAVHGSHWTCVICRVSVKWVRQGLQLSCSRQGLRQPAQCTARHQCSQSIFWIDNEVSGQDAALLRTLQFRTQGTAEVMNESRSFI